MEMLRRLQMVLGAALTICVLSACASSISHPAAFLNAPDVRRCVTVSTPALKNRHVSTIGSDTCIVAAQTFETILYRNGKKVADQMESCVSGCSETVTYACKSAMSSSFSATAKSNKFPPVKSGPVTLACH
jgi:hypothetical protein